MATIEAKRLPLEAFGVAGGGHLYLEFYDDNGNRIGQVNGLATDPVDGSIRTMGDVTSGDLLKVYTEITLAGSGTNKYDNPHEGIEIYSGSYDDVYSAFQIMDTYSQKINSMNLHYDLLAAKDPFFGNDYYNSNSAFSGMLETLKYPLGLSEDIMENARDLGEGFLSYNPGSDDEILTAIPNEEFSDRLQKISEPAYNNFTESGWSGIDPLNAWLDAFTIDGIVTATQERVTLVASVENIHLPTTVNFGYSFGASGTDFTIMISDVVGLVTSVFSVVRNFVSPLSFDLDGDGIETTSLYDTNVFFDIDGDGYAEKVGWIGPDDGMLARDINGDGIINDITELFGDDIMAAYDKLALYDSNGDGVINSSDDAYAELLVWKDLDQDGYSDEGELFTLDDPSVQIKEISLAETPQETYQNENYISGSSGFTRYDNTSGTMYDVHFLNDNVNTWFLGAQSEEFGNTYEVSLEALLLPLSRGYGSLASLIC